jgi:murein DD-endopeptidase MepM/ murein hydrolase activator NlpD
MPLMMSARIRALGVVILLGALAVPPSAADGSQPAPNDRVRQLREQIGEASADEGAALAELAAIRDRRQELDGAVAAFDRRIAGVEGQLASLQTDIDRLTARAAELDGRADTARVQLDVARRRAAQAAAAMYRGEYGVPVYAEVLDVDNIYDAFVGTKYLTHISERRRADVDALTGLRQQIESLQQQAAAQRDQATVAQQHAQEERTQLAALRAEQQQQRDAIGQEEEREQALVASIQARKDQFTDELVALQASSNAISQMLASRQRGQVRATSFRISRPVPGQITGAFGPRVHPILGTVRMHTGIDMQAAQGEPIKAAASGVVAFAGIRSGYGDTVIIDHGNQFATLYGHASVLKVSTGQTVKVGQIVALAGSTGLATGPHLHFEVRILGVPVNPISYM